MGARNELIYLTELLKRLANFLSACCLVFTSSTYRASTLGSHLVYDKLVENTHLLTTIQSHTGWHRHTMTEKYMHLHTYRQTDTHKTHTNRHMHRQTNQHIRMQRETQTDICTDRCKYRQPDKQTYAQKHMVTYTQTDMNAQTDTDADRHKQR